MDGAHVAGGGGATVYRCQWPGCTQLADHETRRGATKYFGTAYMRVCRRHMLAFRELSDTEAFAISADRQSDQRRCIARGHAPWALTDDELTHARRPGATIDADEPDAGTR